jgi:hypothetical protein
MLYIRLNCVIQNFIHASCTESKPSSFAHYQIYSRFHSEAPFLGALRVQFEWALWKCTERLRPMKSFVYIPSHTGSFKIQALILWHYITSSKGTRMRHHRLVTYTITSLFIHSWSWALLEKPPVVQLLKNFPAFYGTRRFITVFTRALHWSLSWARSI